MTIAIGIVAALAALAWVIQVIDTRKVKQLLRANINRRQELELIVHMHGCFPEELHPEGTTVVCPDCGAAWKAGAFEAIIGDTLDDPSGWSQEWDLAGFAWLWRGTTRPPEAN